MPGLVGCSGEPARELAGSAGISQDHSERYTVSGGATGAGAENTMDVRITAQNTTRPIKPIELNSFILPARKALTLIRLLRK